jgi:mannose-6-phosphate isomerase-like protein (cupin superfamily)
MPHKPFATMQLPAEVDAIAPDGSAIRELLTLRGGSMAHCTLPPGTTSIPVRHRTVEEIWYVVAGQGEVWRTQEGHEEVSLVAPGSCLTIPLSTTFQFRTVGAKSLELLLVTMPPWPGEHEAERFPQGGRWPAS